MPNVSLRRKVFPTPPWSGARDTSRRCDIVRGRRQRSTGPPGGCASTCCEARLWGAPGCPGIQVHLEGLVPTGGWGQDRQPDSRSNCCPVRCRPVESVLGIAECLVWKAAEWPRAVDNPPSQADCGELLGGGTPTCYAPPFRVARKPRTPSATRCIGGEDRPSDAAGLRPSPISLARTERRAAYLGATTG